MPRRVWTTLLLVACATFALPSALRSAAPVTHAAPVPHACNHSALQAVPGLSGVFRLETARATLTLRWPPEAERSLAPDFVINGLDNTWDAPGSGDTLVVPVGSHVRWHLTTGIHTITDGLSLDDPEAGGRFDYLLDPQHPDFDTTFTAPDTVNYFCAFHDPDMRGVLVISANASVPDDPAAHVMHFTRLPAPNPTRGTMSCAISMPTASPVEVDVWDLGGRRIAWLERADLPAGEHTFRWDGRTSGGQHAAAGTYLVRVSANNVRAARRFTLLR